MKKLIAYKREVYSCHIDIITKTKRMKISWGIKRVYVHINMLPLNELFLTLVSQAFNALKRAKYNVR